MARVFIHDAHVETAVRVREAAAADGHDAEILADLGAIERRLRGEDTLALVLTGDPASRSVRRAIAQLASRIPRPPVVAVVEPADASAAAELEADVVLTTPIEPAEVQVALAQEIERFELQLATGILGRTDGIREVLGRISTIAQVQSTVLVTGESGTGKELVARAIHSLSARRGGPFIAVNCAAIPESLLESELFGHEKGAFTGASSRRKGMFELADGGSLLLDEIGEMPLLLQTRLLRVLESKRFMRVGGDSEIEVRVRVIAATNQDLREAVRRGSFRKDLYYRLNVLAVQLPPLRERRSDIPLLIRRFIDEFSRTHDREFKGLSPEAMQILLDYEWPGNIRELRNLVESMVVLAPGEVIQADDIPLTVRETSGRALIPLRSGERLSDRQPVPTDDESVGQLPQMEFLFRTLVEMKIDLEDLRAEFERFRRRHAERADDGWEDTGDMPVPAGRSIEAALAPIEVRGGEDETDETDEPAPTIRLEPDMTMADIERAAITIALDEVDGNRRRAAERLGIGERTLYRKLKEYDIES
ncbi:MAG TPA: sigma 54-interacting transcriptional regulator [Gemmatimonadota bacterium]|nr:sigma 54-interacting transcriptional regulator [Gemmatimonadota bacterium]